MISVKDIDKFRNLIDRVYGHAKYKKLRQDMTNYLEQFRGHYWKVGEKGHKASDSEIFCNYLFSTTMTIAPLITDNRPIWYATPRFAFLQKLFNIYSEALEYLWDKLDLEMKFFKAELIALIMKAGIWKVWYDPDKEDGLGEVTVEIGDPRTMVIAPGFDDSWEAPWSGTVTMRPLSWVWMNYPEKGKKVKWTNDEGKKIDESRSAEEDVQDKMVKIYEIFIKDSTIEDYIFETEDGKKEKRKKKKYKNGRFIVFSEDQVLEDKEYPYRHGKPPWVMFYDYWNPFELFGMGEADQIETLNLEFNLGLKKFANYVRRWTGVNVTVDAGSGMDPEKVKEQIAAGEDNVWSKNTGTEAPESVDWGQINPAILQFIQALPVLIEEITGVTDVSKGMVTKKQRQSASEIATLIESSYTRTRQKVRNSEWSIKRALYLILDLMQQFYTIPRPYKIERDGNMIFNSVGSSKEAVGAMMTPENKPEAGGVPSVESNQEYEQEVKDFEEFIREFGDVDQVYADFDLQVQTNSTLPMDRQSLANLMLRLFELKAVDAEALLETLRVPKSKEIVERLQKMQYAEQGGGQPPAPGGGMEQPPPNPLQPGGM